MTKETVRFPDGLVDRIRSAVEDSELFESRSEFHRVSSELLLDLLDPEHEPTNFSYRELRTEIEAELGVDLAGAPSLAAGESGGEGNGDDGDFLAAYIDVRRRALGGDLAGAREEVDRRYDATDPEALLLDEVIGQYRDEGQVVAADSGAGEGTDPDRETRDRPEPDERTDGRASRERPPTSADGGEPGGDGEPAERDHTDGPEPRHHGE